MGTRTGNPKGRPKGAKNKRTVEREEAMAEVAAQVAEAMPGAFAGDAHALLVWVYKNPANEIQLRVDAAKAAIRYETPALATVELSGPDGGAIPYERIERVVIDAAHAEN